MILFGKSLFGFLLLSECLLCLLLWLAAHATGFLARCAILHGFALCEFSEAIHQLLLLTLKIFRFSRYLRFIHRFGALPELGLLIKDFFQGFFYLGQR